MVGVLAAWPDLLWRLWFRQGAWVVEFALVPILLSELTALRPLPKWVDSRRCGCPIYERALSPGQGRARRTPRVPRL